MGEISEKTAGETLDKVAEAESGGPEMTPGQALRKLASGNDWLIAKIGENKECGCNSCHLCAYNTLKDAIRTDNVQPSGDSA
jgi:hypothetical protein